MNTQQKGWRLVAKRCFDVASALVALVLLMPVLTIAAVAVAITMGLPILFRHERPGRNGRIFTLYKFRTMRMARTAAESGIEHDAERLTPVGAFLRRWSIDELPQFFN